MSDSSSALPQFRPYPYDAMQVFARDLFTTPDGTVHLRLVVAHEDAHFRLIFDLAYFTLADGQSEPSKSQWNTLKKHIKRHNAQLFIFKEHGELEHDGARCGYLDCGFFAQPAPPKRPYYNDRRR
jgi:hypothetical protein